MLSRALAGAARQVSVSAARAERQLLRDKQMSRLTSTAQPAAPAAEAPKPAAAGSPEPAQSAPKAGERQSNSGGGSEGRPWYQELVAVLGIGGAFCTGTWATFQAQQQKQDVEKAVKTMENVTQTEQLKAEMNLTRLVNDAKENMRLHKEALQVQQEAVKSQASYGVWAPFLSSAVGFVLSATAAALISRSSK